MNYQTEKKYHRSTKVDPQSVTPNDRVVSMTYGIGLGGVAYVDNGTKYIHGVHLDYKYSQIIKGCGLAVWENYCNALMYKVYYLK